MNVTVNKVSNQDGVYSGELSYRSGASAGGSFFVTELGLNGDVPCSVALADLNELGTYHPQYFQVKHHFKLMVRVYDLHRLRGPLRQLNNASILRNRFLVEVSKPEPVLNTEKRLVVDITYTNSSGEERRREVEVHGMETTEQGVMLVGWCRMRNAWRKFYTHRIVLNRSFIEDCEKRNA